MVYSKLEFLRPQLEQSALFCFFSFEIMSNLSHLETLKGDTLVKCTKIYRDKGQDVQVKSDAKHITRTCVHSSSFDQHRDRKTQSISELEFVRFTLHV
jgi:hypothetical protein